MSRETRTMLKEVDVQALAAQIFAAKLGPLGFDHVEVSSGIDQDGERSFFLDAFFRPGTEIKAVRALVDAQTELHDSLISKGEERPPYVSFRLPDDGEPLSDDLDDEAQPARP